MSNVEETKKVIHKCSYFKSTKIKLSKFVLKNKEIRQGSKIKDNQISLNVLVHRRLRFFSRNFFDKEVFCKFAMSVYFTHP